jgi:hypothetical protein
MGNGFLFTFHLSRDTSLNSSKKIVGRQHFFFEELIRLTTLSDAYFFSVYWNFPGFFFFPCYPLEQTNKNQQPTSSSWW